MTVSIFRQSTIFVLYTYATILMLFIRPLLATFIDRKLISASIYSALHFYPCLLILHTVVGGVICMYKILRNSIIDSNEIRSRFLIPYIDHCQWYTSQCNSLHYNGKR